MNQELFLLKMGEIVLKGLNRRRFEERLMGNLQRRLHPYGRFRAISRQSIVYVEPLEETCDLDGAWESGRRRAGSLAVPEFPGKRSRHPAAAGRTGTGPRPVSFRYDGRAGYGRNSPSIGRHDRRQEAISPRQVTALFR